MDENTYKNEVFLTNLLDTPDYTKHRMWAEHQEMQARFLQTKGFCSASNVLDVGCGPLRLGVRLIPELDTGWYFGQDINQNTLELGRRVLADAGVTSKKFSLLCSDSFNFSAVDRPIDIAFSNSLFSHLNLNSILLCLANVRAQLKDSGVYYSTFFDVEPEKWANPYPRNKWGTIVRTFPRRDPYHYPAELLAVMARGTGFEMTIAEDFGHPTQTMACFTAVS